jgi:hypothetical protein
LYFRLSRQNPKTFFGERGERVGLREREIGEKMKESYIEGYIVCCVKETDRERKEREK